MRELWNKLFLGERPSIGLAFFRIAAALTTGFHVIPSFFHLDDNYFSTAFKTFNYNFFTPGVIALVQKSPDAVVLFFVFLFCLTWFFFLIGFFTQASGILLMLSCYYFYALNAFHIGTLSWDILLVVLFLMCLTPYPGDYFSVDCLRRHNENAYKRERPFFIQRLLQLQIASTYFYTALYKVTAQGNWLTGNPMYYLMNYPPEGVTKQFFLKEFFSVHPGLCYVLGLLILAVEFLLPFFLFIPRTRFSAIVTGLFFHLGLLLTFDVPTIFFFLFVPQLLLFINPDKVIEWVERRRQRPREEKSILVYDGRCGFCQSSVQQLRVMDLLGVLEMVDFHQVPNLPVLHPLLTNEKANSEIYLVDRYDGLYSGFFVFRKLALRLPMMYPLIFVFYFPGAGIIGPWVYRWVARHRYLFHANKHCQANACFR